MSASNWAICPRCQQILTQELEDKQAKIRDGYIPEQEFFKLLEDAKLLESALETTLREDYEIYMEFTGHLYVNYRCSCRVCEWHYEYQRSIEAALWLFSVIPMNSLT